VESSDLLVNLVVALAAALVGALIAARLGQSVILGYILAGVAIGPYTPGFVGDRTTVEALAEIGVILLMFAIGVQFSLRDLLRSGRAAMVGSTVQVLATIGLGALVGVTFGWEPIEALFFGAVISNSSSTVLSKVLGDRGEMNTPPGRLALAWSTMQDLGTVVLIVLLSALATDSDALLLDLAREVGKALLFLVLLIPVGLRALPWLFAKVAALRSREVFVMTVAVVALGLSYGASFFGLSLALGAFVAGVVVSESDLSHQILGEVLPLRDIFAGLFFVSVGMLVDPGFVARNLPLLLLTLLLIVAIKGGIVAALAWWLSTPTRAAVLTGALLAQSAEFSFLLARVGEDVDAVSPTVFSLMLAGAAASIVLAPGVYVGAKPLAAALGDRRPALRSVAVLDPPAADPAPSGHAIICGYGRVGSVVGQAIGRRFRFVAIEEDPRVVELLRRQEVRVVQGNAAIPMVLEQANPARASVLVVALPDPVATRQIVDYVRERYPRLDVVVRTHSAAERRLLIERGVEEVVLGEWELALEMTRHTLRRFGVGTLEAQELIQRLRRQVGTEPAPGGRRAGQAKSRAVASRRTRLGEAEAASARRGEVDVEGQADAEPEGMGHRLRQRAGDLRRPGPAVGRSDGVDVDQPEPETVQRTGAQEDGQKATQPPARRDEDGEAQPEDRAQHQVDQGPGDQHRPEPGVRIERGGAMQKGGGEPERPEAG
jgi:CPA2 family monovalent cation:H+ antiporter-2